MVIFAPPAGTVTLVYAILTSLSFGDFAGLYHPGYFDLSDDSLNSRLNLNLSLILFRTVFSHLTTIP
jgi:hypothetical protein